MDVEYQEKHPPRKVYRITEAGNRELKRWLSAPIGIPSLRIPFLVKVFFGGCLEKKEMIALLRDQLELHRVLLEQYQQIQREILANNKSTHKQREIFFGNLTLEAGINFERSWIDWLEESIVSIEKMNEEDVKGDD